MSRVGLSTIKIPDGVTVTFVDGEFTAKGKNGELSIKTHNLIDSKLSIKIHWLKKNINHTC